MTPIGKCDRESVIEQLSPTCKAFVEEHRSRTDGAVAWKVHRKPGTEIQAAAM